jgi:pyruvate formate lyase activating enzyme
VNFYEKSVKGIVFDIQRYSIHDGPGIRTVVFLKGCPLRCEWCSNPESNQDEIELLYNAKICILCKQCISFCPTNALTVKQEKYIDVNRIKCSKCGKCTEICPTGALLLSGRYMTVEEVLQEVKKDLFFYHKSGGGITLSGGEPTRQPEFCEAIIKSVYSMSISVAIETCGYCSYEILQKLAKWTDLFLYDIKHVDDIKHINRTGVSNQIILDNLKKLIDSGVSVIVRIPVIPDFNATITDMRLICKFLSNIGGFKEIHLLPYHRLGDSKAIQLGKTRKMNKKPLSKPILLSLKNIADKFGFKVQIGG